MSVGGVSIGAYAEPRPATASCLVWLASNADGLFKRENNVWSEVTLPISMGGGVSRIAAIDNLPDVLFISNGEDQAVTENRGSTWTDCAPFATLRSVHDIAIGPDANTLYVAQFSSDDPSVPGNSPGRIWRSTDKGSNWTLWREGNQANDGSYGLLLPRIAWSDEGSGFYAVYSVDADQNGPDNIELHYHDLAGSAFDLHTDIGAGESNTDIMISKIRGVVPSLWDLLFIWTRTFPPTGDFGVWRWNYAFVEEVTPPGFVTATNDRWIGVHGHPDGTTLAFFHTNVGSLMSIIRSLNLGDTWTTLDQFSDSNLGADPAFFQTSSVTLRQNACVNPGDSSEWWALGAKNGQILHSLDKGSSWSIEGVTGYTLGQQIIAVPV